MQSLTEFTTASIIKELVVFCFFLNKKAMQEELKLIWILAIGLSAACAAGYVAQCLRLSPILGYLLAGYFIGPNSPGYSIDQGVSDQLANIGVTLLMFSVGLNFSWKDIGEVKKIVIIGGVLLALLTIGAGIGLSVFLGETVSSGFVIGAAICVSSSVVIVRVLADQNLLHTKQGHVVMGWTIVEDLVSIFALILLPALIYSPAEGSSVFQSISYSVVVILLKVFILGLIVYLVGVKLIEAILKVIARTRSHELFTLAILAVVFLIAVGSSYFFGISIALGAFIAGTVVGKTELSHQAAANALPMRDAFAVIFFLSVGMLFNPLVVMQNLPFFIGILLILLVFRPVLAFAICRAGNYPSFIGVTVALAITQIGEYSFILAEEGSRLRILPDTIYDIIVACAFLTIAINPFLFQLFRSALIPKTRTLHGKSDEVEELVSLAPFLPQAIVVGYGPIGRAVSHYLKDHHYVVVIDRNIDTVTSLKEKGIKLIFGDATHLQILERANVENVRLIVITTPEVQVTHSIIEAVQHINPSATIVARTHFKADFDQAKFGDIPIICDEEASAEKMIAAIAKELKI